MADCPGYNKDDADIDSRYNVSSILADARFNSNKIILIFDFNFSSAAKIAARMNKSLSSSII